MLTIHDLRSLAGLDDQDLFRVGIKRSIKRLSVGATAANRSEVSIQPTDKNMVACIRQIWPETPTVANPVICGYSQDAATGTIENMVQSDWQGFQRGGAVAPSGLPGVEVRSRSTVPGGYSVFHQVCVWQAGPPAGWPFSPIYLITPVVPALIFVIGVGTINVALNVNVELWTFPVELDVMQRDTKGSWFQPFIGETVSGRR